MATTVRHTATLALAHALSAAERGLPVFPLSPTKLPAVRSPHRDEPGPVTCHGACGRPGHGVHDATTDPAEVRALFAAAPWATGYGIACGRAPHHLIGIDLDVAPGPHPHGQHDSGQHDSGPYDSGPYDSGAALRQLAFQHLFTLPETVVVLTPSGGRHIWLTGPSNVVVPNSAGRLAPGIEVRGAGGYLVGPGSVTARGAYRLAAGAEGRPPAPCPRALLRLLTPPPGPRHAQEAPTRGHGLVRFVLAAHEGQRNTRLFWAACRAYEHGFGDALTRDLVEAAVRTGLPEHEARATIASAARLTTRP
ncbi:bifunctional DNA primase/polymerase [Streptomyces sp. NPDC093085]|uniref:bifunctional DNA primase/polymerase n=1 Tax=Streptomyces sp. NPDC093085 TaxID=3155068 RepID=UPI003419DD37